LSKNRKSYSSFKCHLLHLKASGQTKNQLSTSQGSLACKISKRDEQNVEFQQQNKAEGCRDVGKTRVTIAHVSDAPDDQNCYQIKSKSTERMLIHTQKVPDRNNDLSTTENVRKTVDCQIYLQKRVRGQKELAFPVG
jgi:hypothetical protein